MGLKLFWLLVFTLINSSANTQDNFFVSLEDTSVNEPNNSNFVHSENDYHYILGKKFDFDKGFWNVFVSKFDSVGTLVGSYTIEGDTIPFVNINNYSSRNGNKLNFLAFSLKDAVILEYDLFTDVLSKKYVFDKSNFNFNVTCFLIDYAFDAFYIGGSTIDDGEENFSIVNITDIDTTFYHSIDIRGTQVSNLRFDKSNNLIVATKIFAQGRPKVKLYKFDKSLSLIEESIELDSTTLKGGMAVDFFNNVVLTGTQISSGIISEIIIKFNNELKHEWNTEVGQNVNNFQGFGQWNSVEYSSNDDSFVFCGSQYFDLESTDSIISIPTIGKISSDAEILWMEEYAFRDKTGHLIETFRDVIINSNGSIVASGVSIDFDSVHEPWQASVLAKVNKNGTLLSTSTQNLTLPENHISLSVFPNPTAKYFNIKSSMQSEINGMLTVFNSEGRLMKEESISIGPEGTKSVDVDNFPPDVYLLKIATSEGEFLRKLIKN